MTEISGQRERGLAEQFFAALTQRDARALFDLLDESPTFENIDGPLAVDGRADLARTLVARAEGVRYRVVESTGAEGRASCRFLLVVDGVPGSILLEAQFRIAGERIAAIRVLQPSPPG